MALNIPLTETRGHTSKVMWLAMLVFAVSIGGAAVTIYGSAPTDASDSGALILDSTFAFGLVICFCAACLWGLVIYRVGRIIDSLTEFSDTSARSLGPDVGP